MPTCRRKRVLLTEPSQTLLDALKRDPNKDVFYLAQTGELFETYESVPSTMSPICPYLICHPLIQGVCRSDVLLPAEAIPM
jgi:hypothetical protein